MRKQNQNSKLKTENFLKEIVEIKRRDISLKTRNISVSEYQSFRKSDSQRFLKIFGENRKIGLIAEVKFASPTNPYLGSSKELIERVKQYEKAGADAISVITEKHFFKGDVSFVSKVKKHISLPVLQKDFVIDPYQIYEAAKNGSDALLLIARLVDATVLTKFVELCFLLGIEPVVEVNSEEDLAKAVVTKTNIVAVNARDLETFVIDVSKACVLIKKIPDRFIKLGFSGIKSAEEVRVYHEAGANGVLVGTSLMKANNIKEFIKNLRVLPEAPFQRARSSEAFLLGRFNELRAFGNLSASVTRKTSPVKVKICGVRSLEAAKVAVEAGADFIGLNFVPRSKRYIELDAAQQIVAKVKGKVEIVGVFQNELPEKVNAFADLLNLDFVQLHGEEDIAYMQKMNYPIIQRVDIENDSMSLPAAFLLVDRAEQGRGEMVDLTKARKLAKQFPLFFSGGLTVENVATVMRQVKPFAVDVASGVETNGKEDLQKIQAFIRNAKGI